MAKNKKIGILTGGGDCPGLNAATKRIVTAADSYGYSVEGITEGWRGPSMVANGEYPIAIVTLPLDMVAVRRIDREGGTILMSSRDNPFKYKTKEGDIDLSDKVVELLNKRYHSVIAVGGEDTLGVAGKLARKGLRVIGIPKTIDKDLCGTEYTLGFDSALNIVTTELENLRSTAGSHGMVYFVEIMGRRASHLSYWAAVASDCHFLTICEVEINKDKLFDRISERKNSLEMKRGYTRDGRRYVIVAVAEGTNLEGIGEVRQGKTDAHGNVYLGGVGEFLAKEFREYAKANGRGYDARPLVLGHVQRSGKPSVKDRTVARYFGERSVELVRRDSFGRMVSMQGTDLKDVSLEVVIERMRVLDPKCYDRENFKPIINPYQMMHEMEVPKPTK